MQSLILRFIDFLEKEWQEEQSIFKKLHDDNTQTHVLLQQVLTALHTVLANQQQQNKELSQMSDAQNTLSAQGQQLLDETAKQTDIVASVQTYVTGLSNQLAAALAQASAGGATPDQLAALHEVRDRLVANDAALSAILANTTAGGGTPAPAPAPTPGTPGTTAPGVAPVVPTPAPGTPAPTPAPAPTASPATPEQPAPAPTADVPPETGPTPPTA